MKRGPSGPFESVVRAQETEADITVVASTPFGPVLSANVSVTPQGGLITARASLAGQHVGADPANALRYRFVATLLDGAGNPTATVIEVPATGTTERDTTEISTIPYTRTFPVTRGAWRVQLLARAVGTDFTILAATLPNGNHAYLELLADGSGQSLVDVENGV